MKKTVLILSAIIFLSSCKSYLLSTVSAPNTKLDQSTGALTMQNDSLAITYNFSGEGSLLNIDVQNKLNEPLYVNWEKSAIIVNTKAYSLVDDKLKIKGETSSSSSDFFNTGITSSNGRISGIVQLSKNESFIPPNSRINKVTDILSTIESSKIPDSAYHKVILNDTETGVINGKQSEFTPENSPLAFKTYLTLYTVKDNTQKFFSNQQDFYVSKVLKTSVNPKNIENFNTLPGNVMILSKSTGYGTAVTVLALSAVVVGTGVAAAAVDNNNNKNTTKK